MRFSGLVLSTVLLSTPALQAHELWLEPLSYQVAQGGQLQARIVNGEEFLGNQQPYIPSRFQHFVMSSPERNITVPGRAGDTPALNMAAQDNGLHVIVYQSEPAIISYTSWAKFAKFAAHKDFGDVRPRHEARGLDINNFSETYVRFSKTLIGVGDGAGADKRMGLETELVALTNPYTDDLSDGMKVKLFYGQDVRANEQVEVFARGADGTVEITLVRTDAAGVATVPVTPGTEYQLDAVVLREPQGETTAVWETLWANLTFRTPD